ncbi:hypothetical protein JCM11641_002412 [Rhodosporidiobolus odoratus]
MRTTILSASLAVVAFAGSSSAGGRTIKIVNKCSFSVWPVVSPFTNQKEPYADDKAWEATSGSSKSITVSSKFTGRIWARHGCVKQTDGTLNCVTGACADNAFECKDGELGTATNLELRLSSSNNGQYDVIDLQNGGGWSMPVEVVPEGDDCSSISCTPTLSTCPAELALQDSYGNVLGCLSSCYAHVGDAAVQCCSGDYSNADSCTPDLITYRDYFKNACPHAYSYFQDSRTGQPTVDYLCSSEDDPGFTFTFCPDGDGDSAGGNAGAAGASGAKSGSNASASGGKGGSAAGSDKTASGAAGQPTGSGGDAAPSGIAALTSAASVDASSALSIQQADSVTPTKAPASTGAAVPSSSPSSSSGSSSAEEDSSDSEGTTLGMSSTMLWGLIAVVAVFAILAIGITAFCVHRRRQKQAAQANEAASDTEAGSAGGQAASMSQAKTGNNPAQNYNTLGRSGSSRSRASRALLSSSDSGSSSSEEDVAHFRPASSAASRRASVSSRTSRR